jgi:N-methylhydantoinase A
VVPPICDDSLAGPREHPFASAQAGMAISEGSPHMSYRVGVDIGGTFTDLCAFDEATNRLHTLKVLSTPDKPGSEVMDGLRQLERRYGVPPREIVYFTHGTTVGVNTVIQRKGIRLCLFVTENFVDVLEVARLKVPDPYTLHSRRPEPLV